MDILQSSILLANHDLEFTDLLTAALTKHNFNVISANNGEIAIKKALNEKIDIILLDVMLPKINGFAVLKTIRQYIQTPILMLTSRIDDIDKLVGLEIGADDYLTQPCDLRELVARLRAILRRTQPHNHAVRSPIIASHDLILDRTKRCAFYLDKPLELTNIEFNILEMLLKTPGQVFSKQELTEYALGRKYTIYDRSIDVHISNLRNKLDNNKQDNPVIKTIRGFGYALFSS